MKRSALIIGTGLFASLAAADVTLTMNVKGYDDFFDRCDFKIAAEPSAGIKEANILYRVHIPEKGGAMCLQDSSSRNCQSTHDFEYTCDDMQSLEVLGVGCTDADSNAVSCGTVSLGQTVGDDIPVSVPEMPGDAGATTQIFAAFLGNDDFFDSCKIGTGYVSSADIDYAEIVFQINVGDKGHQNCTASASNGISSGLGCSSSGSFDYTCAEVTAVEIQSISCQKDDAVADCGSVTVRTPEPAVIKNGL